MPLKLKDTVFFILYLCLCGFVQAQAVQTKEANYRDPVLDRQFGIIAEVKAKPAGVEGSSYLSQEWNMGNIYMKSGDTIKNYPLMYDLDKRQIEIKVQDLVKILPADQVIAFEWQNKAGKSSSFINSSYYIVEGTPIIGFFEVLAAGDVQLLSRTTVETKKANYNIALDVGSKSDQIIKKEKLYLARDKKLIELKGNENISVFGAQEQTMKQYIKENKLKFTRKEDAIQIVNHFNDL